MDTVKNLKAERGLNSTELAKRAGISRAGLWQIETDKVRPNLQTLEKLAKALGVSVHDLIGEER